ncbi:UDP-glycosyltransferase 88A1 [Vitis vinifera]|uniref:UDP-glycosyltransferase 88A1 n=1 Tax=Vitis vinifera TaxID=29760 RepID=A0A438ICZ2_VITVI|nr:UDP-glycosyltransferase 88A1 [Vitis vinifera]
MCSIFTVWKPRIICGSVSRENQKQCLSGSFPATESPDYQGLSALPRNCNMLTGLSHLVPMVEIGRLLLAHYPSFSITILIATLPSDTASTATYIASIAATTLPFPSTTSPLFLFPTRANGLAMFLYLPTIDRHITKSLKDDLNMHIHVPGTPSIAASDMPLALLDRRTEVYQYFIDTGNQMARSSGIIINTFESFEPRAIKAISEASAFQMHRLLQFSASGHWS